MTELKIALSKLGLSETDWDEFGAAWRTIGEKCPGQSIDSVNCMKREKTKDQKKFQISSSLRQRDQFIAIDDLPELLSCTKSIFQKLDTSDILYMEIPTMKFSESGPTKLHRYDVSQALFYKLVTIKNIKPIQRETLFDILEDHLQGRFPTRMALNNYVIVGQTSKEYFKKLDRKIMQNLARKMQ